MADAGLVAGDAGADVLAQPAPALFGISGSQIIARVMPHRSAWPVGQDPLGALGLVDAAGDEDRLADRLLQRRGEGRQIGVGDRSWAGRYGSRRTSEAEVPAMTLK